MKICALVSVVQDLVTNADGTVTSLASEQIVGYAVFENGVMISQIFRSYAGAAEWMEQALENRDEPCSGPSFGM